MGELNSPSPLPGEPHFVTNMPQKGSVVLVVVLEDVLLLDDVLELVVVLDVVDTLVVVVEGGTGQPASVVRLGALLAILKTLFAMPLVGELTSTPPAAPPNATQNVSPPLIVKRIPPSVPGAGGTTTMWGCGPGPSAPLKVTLTT